MRFADWPRRRCRRGLILLRWRDGIVLEEYGCNAGDDQVGALGVCAAVCADGAVLAAGGWPTLRVLGWIVVCMVAARSAAMAFNRLVDARLDAANPRTAMRALPAGTLSSRFVGGFVVVSAAVFVLGAAMLNRLTLELAPAALGVVLAYSYMKRVTRWSHLVLGLALGIAPTAAWIAVRGSLDWRIVVLTAAVLLWVGGFDVLYACQDFEHDRKVGLNSVPQAFGLAAGVLDCSRDACGDAAAAVSG